MGARPGARAAGAALWDSDDPGFVHRLFRWVRHHERVRMLVYDQGSQPGGPFDLNRYPRSRAAIHAETRRSLFR